MQIQINDIRSFRSPESYGITFDDRQTKVELLNGNTVQDAGRFPSGDAASVTALFRKADYDRIVALWEARQLVTFTDEAGNVYQNVRLVLKSYKHEKAFPEFVLLTFEIWGC